MSSKVQSLDTIGPVKESQSTEPSNPVQAEYEDGKRYFDNQEYGQAAVALHNALVGFEENNDEAGIANASNQLGHVCLARHEFENALKHYQRAFAICDKSNDRMSVLAVLSKMVEVYRALKQYDKATGICLEILDHYQDNRDPQGTVMTLEGLAEIYLEVGNKEKAADTFRTIGAIHKNFKHDKIAAGFVEKADKLEQES